MSNFESTICPVASNDAGISILPKPLTHWVIFYVTWENAFLTFEISGRKAARKLHQKYTRKHFSAILLQKLDDGSLKPISENKLLRLPKGYEVGGEYWKIRQERLAKKKAGKK